MPKRSSTLSKHIHFLRIVSEVLFLSLLFGLAYSLRAHPLHIQHVTHSVLLTTPFPSTYNPTPRPSRPITLPTLHPLSIASMRNRTYTPSQISIISTLPPHNTYSSYIVSYVSDGYTVYGLLAIPNSTPSKDGFSAIIMNHGYIDPKVYSTVSDYESEVDAFASHGYVVLKPDYRGTGQSQGTAEVAYGSPADSIDSLVAFWSLQSYPNVNPNAIGMWGHSMGGNVTLRDIEITSGVRAAVIWSGVVASYQNLISFWGIDSTSPGQTGEESLEALIQKYGMPKQNPIFWNGIDPTQHLDLVSTPMLLQVGLQDTLALPQFSKDLFTSLQAKGKTVQYDEYANESHELQGDAHNQIIDQTLLFFDTYLKPNEQ